MPLMFTYEGATQEMLWEHMSNVSTTSFHNSTNLQDCQNFRFHLWYDSILMVWYDAASGMVLFHLYESVR